MRPAVLLTALVAIVGCGSAPDPLSGRWDVADPQTKAKGHVTVADFKDGRVVFERRGLVLGIGNVSIKTSGTYTVSGNEVTLTKERSEIDASAISDPKLREQTVKVLQGMSGGSEGKPLRYSLKTESPQQITLVNEGGTLTLTRPR